MRRFRSNWKSSLCFVGATVTWSSVRGSRRHEIFFPIGASLSGGRSSVRWCKENCCGGRKEARPVDINRGRGPVADATDELTPVDIKISLLFLTALSQLFDFFFFSLPPHPIFPKPLAPFLFYTNYCGILLRLLLNATQPTASFSMVLLVSSRLISRC